MLEELKVNSRQSFPQMEDRVAKIWSKFPRRYMHGKKTENATGDYVINSNGCQNSFFINNWRRPEEC